MIPPAVSEFARRVRRLRRILLVEYPAYVSLLPALFRSPFHAVESWIAPDGALAREVAVFVHFDATGEVAPRVLSYVAALREAGVSVLFVSNSGQLAAEGKAALQPLCAGILVRRNVGYDFGAMREGLAHFQLPRRDTRMLLLVNDSVLGPFAPLRPVLDRIDFAAADLWGAVDSLQRQYHLQSWFLAAGRRAMDHPAWAQFWASVRPVQSKEWVIGRYEVALTEAMQRHGLRVRALWPYSDLLALLDSAEPDGPAQSRQLAKMRKYLACRHILNPTADLWRQLLAAGCPFVKRELVGRNPAEVVDVDDARAWVARQQQPVS